MPAKLDKPGPHPFWKGMVPEHRSVILQGAAKCAYEAGEILFREGHPANRLFLLHSGQVVLETHVPGKGDVVIAPVVAGQVLGWSWLVPPFIWNFQARAAERTEVTVLDGGHLLIASEHNHYLGCELMKGISKIILEVLIAAHQRWIDTGRRPLCPLRPSPPPEDVEPGSTVETRIARQPFFHGMLPGHLATLAALAQVREFEPGQMPFRAGEPAEGLYLVEQGTLLIEGAVAPEPVPLHAVRAGDAVGWSSFCEPYEWHFDGRAAELTRTLYFKAADLRQRSVEDYHFAYDVTKRITRMMLRHLQSIRDRIWEGCC